MCEPVFFSIRLAFAHACARIDYGESKGTFKTVAENEHAEIMSSYNEGNSQEVIAEKLKRSSRTIWLQIQRRDKAIEHEGYCMKCRRVKGSCDSLKVTKA